MSKVDEKMIDNALKGNLSLKQKIKAKFLASRILAKNYRLGMKTKQIGRNAYDNLCVKCNKKYEELCKDKYSNDDAYNMIKKGYLCEKCNPNMLIYIEHMKSIKVSDIKL